MDEDLLNEEIDPVNFVALKAELAERFEDSRDAKVVVEAMVEVVVASFVVRWVASDLTCKDKGSDSKFKFWAQGSPKQRKRTSSTIYKLHAVEIEHHFVRTDHSSAHYRVGSNR